MYKLDSLKDKLNFFVMTESSKKKKSFSLKKVAKWFGITFFILLILLILIPIFFKDQIKDLVINQANTYLKADIALQDFDLTFISTFPNMSLQLDGFSITGRDTFDQVKLVDINRLELQLGFWSVISGSDVEIRSIALNEPKFDVRILKDGIVNYDIVKSEEELKEEYPDEDIEETPFNLRLSHYEINNAYIRYDDAQSDMFVELVNLTHEGNGDLSADVIDFKTLTSMDELTYRMDGISYLSKVNTNLVMNLLIEFMEESDKFTLQENELRLNNLQLSFDGFYEMFKDYHDMSIDLKADKVSFKDVLSLVPAFYLTGYESMLAQGDVQIGGFVKGRMDEVNLPAFDFSTKVNNAVIDYPDAPSKFEDIRLALDTKFPGGSNLDLLKVDLHQFSASFVGNTIDASLHLRNVMSDPYLTAKLLANVDLSTLDKVMPMEEGESYQGVLFSDLFLDGKTSSLEEEKYDEFTAKGKLSLSDFEYQSESLTDEITIKELAFLFSPQALNLENLEGTMGVSDFKMTGSVDNYMGYLFKEEPIKGKYSFYSHQLDLDALMPAYDEETIEEDSEIEEKFEEEDFLLIPDNIDFVLNTKIDNLLYDGMLIQDVNGLLIIRDEIVQMERLNMNMLEGSVGLTGNYNTQNHLQPKVDFSYDLRNIDIEKLNAHFSSISTMAPIAKHAKGKISSDLKTVCLIKPDFEPIYSTLTGEGTLRTNEVRIEGYEPLERLNNTLDIKELRNTTFRNLNVSFAFEDGKVNVQPFAFNMGNIRTNVQGSTSFEQEIDYKLRLDVPKQAIPAAAIETIERALAQANKIPGFKMKELPAIIPVNALITNTVTNPRVETDFREQLMQLGGDVKGAVKDLVDETVTKVKDTVRATITEKVEDVKDDLRERRDKLISDAQQRADKVVAEAKVLADRTRKEGDENAQKLIDEANNPIQRRAAEAGAKRIRDQAENAAQRIEREAQENADRIMSSAREQADRLE